MKPITTLQIVVTGKPVPWARAGLSGKRHFTRARPGEWKSLAGFLARAEMGGHPPLAGCMGLKVWAYFPVPQYWPAWKKVLALTDRIRPSGTPDMDNLTKIAKDSLNQIVWIDDAQVVEEKAEKYYSENPRVEIVVYVLDAHPSNITRNPDR